MSRVWPFRHFGLKLLALAVALLLWMAIAGEEIVERGLRVPLELQQLPPGVELTGEVPATVDVRVRGGSATLSRVTAADLVAVLDLRSARPGRRVFPLTEDQVRVPFGVDVVQITPSALALVFEATVSKRVPVVPVVDGHPAPGYVVGPMTVDPAVVEIVGPESAVERATEAVTEPVSVTGARENVREAVTLGVLDAPVRLKNVRAATVTVQILPAPLEQTFRNRPVHLRNLARGLTAHAEPATVDVTVSASRELLARITPDDVMASVDAAGLRGGRYQLAVHAEALQAGVTRVEPSMVQIRIARGK